MKITVPCENCGNKLTIDTATLPPVNSIVLKASKDKTREVYVDCPKCGGETAAEVPIEDAKKPAKAAAKLAARKPAKKKK